MNRQNEAEMPQQTNEIHSIENFFDILLSGRGDPVSPNIVVGFFLAFAFLFILMPWQSLQENVVFAFCAALFFGFGVSLYINPYTKVMENRQQVSVFGKLKYYPADLKSMKKYLLKKTEIFTKKIFWAALILQCLAALIGYHSVTLANVAYVSVVAYIWPMINGWCMIVLSK